MKNPLGCLLVCSLAIALCGCSTGVVPMGKDTYMISRKGTGWATHGEMKAKCYRDANKFCAKRGLEMVPVSTTGKDGTPGFLPATCELTFRAVPPNDPENVRPIIQKVPDITVEHRER
jgi:hypothetical protein